MDVGASLIGCSIPFNMISSVGFGVELRVQMERVGLRMSVPVVEAESSSNVRLYCSVFLTDETGANPTVEDVLKAFCYTLHGVCQIYETDYASAVEVRSRGIEPQAQARFYPDHAHRALSLLGPPPPPPELVPIEELGLFR